MRIYGSLLLLLFLLALVMVPITFADTSYQTELPEVYVEALGTANLRSGPSTDFDIIKEITAGAEYRVLAQHALVPWLLLEIPDIPTRAGWVYEDLVQLKRGDLAQVRFENAFEELPIVGTTPAATSDASGAATVQPLIIAPASTGATTTVTLVPPTLAPANLVTARLIGRSNVRYGPGVDYPIMITLDEGTIMTVLARHSQYPWYKVAIEGVPNGSGWVVDSVVEITGSIYDVPVITDLVLPYPTPTATPPSVVSMDIPWSDFGAVDSSSLVQNLGEQIHNFLLNQDPVVAPRSDHEASVFVLDLTTQQHFILNGDVAFSGMSINKIAILVDYFLNLDTPLQNEQAELIATTMICSENITTNELLTHIGAGNPMEGAASVTQMMEELDLGNSFLVAPYLTGEASATPFPAVSTKPTHVDQQRTQPDSTNQITVEEIGWLLGSVYQCAADGTGPLMNTFPGRINQTECRQILRAMSANHIGSLTEAAVQPGAIVAHKHGWIRDTIGDAGIVFGPNGAYVLVMAYHQHLPDDPNAWIDADFSFTILEQIALMTWNYFNPAAPLAQTRSMAVSETCDIYADPVIPDMLSGIFNPPGFTTQSGTE